MKKKISLINLKDAPRLEKSSSNNFFFYFKESKALSIFTVLFSQLKGF